MFGRRCRTQSVERVVRDVRALRHKGYRSFFFYDDNFTADRQRARRVLEGVADLDILWTAQARLDFAWENPQRRDRRDQGLLDAMRRAGADVLYVGYETVDDKTARHWGKGYQGAGALETRSTEDTRILHDAGFWIHGMFIMSPAHDERAADRVLAFALRNRIESMQISALTPFPGSAIFEQSKGRLALTSYPDDWDFYDGAHVLYADTRMGIRAFQEKLMEVHRSFYRSTGFDLGRLGKFVRGPGTARDKLRDLMMNVRLAGQVFCAMARENREFLRKVASVNPDYLLPPADRRRTSTAMAAAARQGTFADAAKGEQR